MKNKMKKILCSLLTVILLVSCFAGTVNAAERAMGKFDVTVKVLQSPSVVPQNFNHFSTYWHQKSTKLFGGFSLSIPFGASFTVSPENKFSNPVEDTILATWNKK